MAQDARPTCFGCLFTIGMGVRHAEDVTGAVFLFSFHVSIHRHPPSSVLRWFDGSFNL